MFDWKDRNLEMTLLLMGWANKLRSSLVFKMHQVLFEIRRRTEYLDKYLRVLASFLLPCPYNKATGS